MELGLSSTLLADDPRLIDHIVGEVKSQGIFDQFRKECIADVDTKVSNSDRTTQSHFSRKKFSQSNLFRVTRTMNNLI